MRNRTRLLGSVQPNVELAECTEANWLRAFDRPGVKPEVASITAGVAEKIL